MRGPFGFLVLALGVGVVITTVESDVSDAMLSTSTSLVTTARALAKPQASEPEAGYVGGYTPLEAIAIAALPSAQQALALGKVQLAHRSQAGDAARTSEVDVASVGDAARPETVSVSPWRTAVIVASSAAGAYGAKSADVIAGAGSDTPSVPKGSLVVAVQQELARTGCYSGQIDGYWDRGSKTAMAAFLARVNAKLPLDKPDTVLLNLLRSSPAGLCDVSCPAGQSPGIGGACTLSTHLAKADPRLAAPFVMAEAGVKPLAAISYVEGVEAAPHEAPTGAVADAATSASTLARERPPMPGMMGVGGPVPPAATPDGWAVQVHSMGEDQHLATIARLAAVDVVRAEAVAAPAGAVGLSPLALVDTSVEPSALARETALSSAVSATEKAKPSASLAVQNKDRPPVRAKRAAPQHATRQVLRLFENPLGQP